jgi:uncharacterized membrane protein YhaH (DUF805 family)
MQGLRPLFRYFEFSGRSGRAEFWQWMAYVFIASMLLSLIEIGTSGALGVPRVPIWSTILSLVTFIPGLAVAFRRLHDRNKSGWILGGLYIFLGVTFFLFGIALAMNAAGKGEFMWPFLIAMWLVASIWSIYVIVQLALPGDDFENDFGLPNNDPGEVRERFGGGAGAARMSEARPARRPRPIAEDALVRIERLAELHSKGHLTDEEFAAQKGKLLQGLA